jgi:putative N6-adenine-specific DNA methylase
MPKVFTAAALCAVGAEKVVSNEIRKMGLKIEESGFGRVRFKAGLAELYRSLIGLCAADRVLLEAGRFPAADFDALFNGVKAIAWEEFIPGGMGLRVVKVRSNRSRLRAETSIQAIVHKAAAGRLCEKQGILKLPEGGDEAEIRVYVEKDNVSILLDLSGEPLFKRGYRTEGGAAPLRETTAAAIIRMAGWKRKFPLYDPFCGYGTIAAEAALYAWDLAPGLGRHFTLEKLLISDRAQELQIRDEFLSKVDFSRLVRISGSDADPSAAAGARSNLERMLRSLAGGTEKRPSMPEIKVLAMQEASAPAGESGFIITNPPYGKRLGDPAEAETVYAEMSGLAKRFSGWKLALITDHPGFESFFGRKADSCKEITNGAIQTFLYQYDKL